MTNFDSSGTPRNNSQEREARYQDLLNSRNTLRALFDSLPIAIYIVDQDYTLMAINISRATRVGEKPNLLVGHKCYESLYRRLTPCQGCRVGEMFRHGQNTMRIRRDSLDDDKFAEWEISTYPIYNNQNVPSQSIVVEQDITEKRNLEANLIQSEKLAAVGQLAASIAHEINNPLTAILANVQLMRRDIPSDQEDLMESAKLIEIASVRASQVVRNLLGISRKEKYEFEPVDINETLHNALTLVHHELIKRPIDVTLSLQEGMPMVVASQDQLQGVWINLMINAIDAIDKPLGEISVASRYNGHEFTVAIMDNGKGIPEDHLSHVFEPFFTTKSSGRGTGLGLSVCLRAIKHHGGTIEVESQENKWTRFTVRIPEQ